MTNAIAESGDLKQISTHTLTWSVTLAKPVGQASSGYFNSHAHVERDDGIYRSFKEKYHFNSHAHVERDYKSAHTGDERLYFNSHAHVERDQNHSLQVPYQHISTHTLTWSVTRSIVTEFFGVVFQLTRSRGA